MATPTDSSSTELLGGHLAKLETLLRLLTPDHPFQPSLAATIDLSNWQANFALECELLLKACQQTNPSPKALKACEELYGFAAELFAAPYFAKYLADKNPDRDAGEFLPEPDFFTENCHLQAVASEAREAKRQLVERVTAAENLWHAACTQLYKSLTKPPEPSGTAVLESIQPPSEDDFPSPEISDVLEKLCDPQSHIFKSGKQKNDYDENLWRVRCYLVDTLLPQLTKAVQASFPGKGDENRSDRQQLKEHIQETIDDWLIRFEIVGGWQRLLAAHHSTLALEKLLLTCRDAIGVQAIAQMDTVADRLRFFESLRALPVDILQERRLEKWQRQIEIPKSLTLVVMSICMLCAGTSAVGSTTLVNHLSQEASRQKSKGNGWELSEFANPKTAGKKISRALRKLLTSGLAIHGSQNWVPLPLSSEHRNKTKNLGRMNPQAKQGWLINPLLILLEPVGEVFRENGAIRAVGFAPHRSA